MRGRSFFNLQIFEIRWYYLQIALIGVYVCLLLRLLQLHIRDHETLTLRSETRHLHTIPIPSYRGLLFDREGRPLAVSTPVHSVGCHPHLLDLSAEHFSYLSHYLGLPPSDLKKLLEKKQHQRFFYIKRDITPAAALAIQRLQIPGISLEKTYRRFYPLAHSMAQIIGFTDRNDHGQEGLEAYFEEQLKAQPGQKRVLRDRYGRWLADQEVLQAPHSGHDLTLSLNSLIQTHAWQVLEKMVQETQAKSASCVMIDIPTGEILALVTAPAFNPNNRAERAGESVRLRLLTDPIEPGSTIKVFTIAAALMDGSISLDTTLNTAPGFLKVGDHIIRDARNYGVLSLEEVLVRSSNVGIAKIALDLPHNTLHTFFTRLGFGQISTLHLPSEHPGRLPTQDDPGKLIQASMAFGYGLAITPLQLAHAFVTLGNEGLQRDLSILKRSYPGSTRRIIPKAIARALLDMMTKVTAPQGTGRQAAIPGYVTAGKTGTVRVVGPQGYDRDRHIALFAGLTPMPHPRIATVIVVEEPKTQYYGGQSAAQAYADIVKHSLHWLNVPPL